MAEPAIGEVVEYLEAQQGLPVNVGGMEMRWGATIAVDPETGEWSEVAVADWVKEQRG